MKMHKFLVLGLALLLIICFLIGCGQETEQHKKEQKQEKKAKKIKVGLVYDIDSYGDISLNDSAYTGLKRAEKELGVEITDLEPSGGGEDIDQILRILAEDGYDMIFGVGCIFADHIQKAAEDFPYIKFGLVDGIIEDIDSNSNISCLLFKEYEGSFLAGAAAALKSENKKVGFIGGMKSPLIEKIEYGYLAGAKYINPKIEVYSDYIGTTEGAFKDPVKAKELALKQIEAGADVLYHASGASGVGMIETATENRIFSIGMGSDQSISAIDEQKRYILTSVLKHVDISVYDTIRAFTEGRFEGGYRVFGLADDGVGYAVNEFNEYLIADIQPPLDELRHKIINGEIKVPSNKAEYDEFLKTLK